MDVRVVREGAGYRWLLLAGERPEAVLARAAGTAPDAVSCRAAAELLAEAPSEAIVCVQERDGGWRWRLAAADGTPLAESATRHADAPTCRASALLMQGLLARGEVHACLDRYITV